MAQALYNTNAANTDDVGPAGALTRLRNREIVDRFTGITLADTSAASLSGLGGAAISTGAIAGDTITFTGDVTISAVGAHVFINKIITIDDDVDFIAMGAGVHFYFFNCYFYRTQQNTNRSETSRSIGTNQSDCRVSQGAAATGSVNFYGCNLLSHQLNTANLNNDGFQFSDAMFSTFAIGAGVNRWRMAVLQGARFINASVFGRGANTGVTVELGGTPDIIEGAVFDAAQWEGQNRSTTTLILEQNYTNSGPAQRFRNQAVGQDEQRIINLGFFTPTDNTLGNTVTTGAANNAFPSYLFANNSSGNGVWNFYGRRFEFLDFSGDPIQNVRVQARSNAELSSYTVDAAALANYRTIIASATATIDHTADTIVTINEYLTDTNGVAVNNASTRFSSDGGSTFTDDSWINWLSAGVENTASNRTVGNVLGSTLDNAEAPNNVIPLLLQDISEGRYNQYAAEYEARSYSHAIAVLEEHLGSIGTDAGELPSDQLVEINEATTAAATLVGTVLKNSNVTSTLTPDISFPADNAVSINDIRDARRAEWYAYNFGTSATDPLTQDISFTLNNGLASDYTSTADTITVRANGIEFGTGDLFNTDTNLVAGNFGGGSLQGHALTFSGAVTDLGGMSTAASITAASIAIANGATITDNSTLTATNAITNIGNVSNSRIDGGSVAFASGTRAFENADIESDGAIALSDDHTYGGSTLTSTLSNAINFTSVPADLSDVTLDGSNTEDTGIANIAGDEISTFTDVTWEGVVDFDDTDASIVHVFVRTTFTSLPTNTAGGGVDFQLGVEDTLMSTFGQTTAPTGFTQIFDPLVLTISNPSTTTFPYTIAYNLTDGDGTVTTGTIAQGVADVVIELDRDTFGTDGTTAATLVVTGRGFNDFKEDISYDPNNLVFTPNLAINPLASAGSVTNTLSTTFSGTVFRIQIPAGTTTYSSAGAANTDFLSTKGTINYANYIAATNVSMGLGISVNGGIVFYADGTNIAGIEITAGGLVSPPIQFASFIAAVGQAEPPVQLLGDAAAFNSAIVQGLTIYFDAGAAAEGGATNDSTSLGVVAEPDSSVDYPRISTELTTTIIDTRVTTIDDLTAQTDAIVGTGGESLSGIKSDTEALRSDTQAILESN